MTHENMHSIPVGISFPCVSEERGDFPLAAKQGGIEYFWLILGDGFISLPQEFIFIYLFVCWLVGFKKHLWESKHVPRKQGMDTSVWMQDIYNDFIHSLDAVTPSLPKFISIPGS